MKIGFFIAAVAALLFPTFALEANAADATANRPQVIILKLDDVTTNGAHGDSPVSPRWQRVTDFLEESGLKGSYGIIGYSLEQDNEAYFQWIRDLDKRGLIEFWNHGYRNRKAEDKAGEFEGSYTEQKAALERTQKLAREKLGIDLKAFGPHWSGTNENTVKALAELPEIKMWFYGPDDARQFVFHRVMTLESPTFVPDFAKFKARYEEVGRDEKCLALQGHPNAWDEGRWDGFVKIVEYLRQQGCVFMPPAQYLQTVSGR